MLLAACGMVRKKHCRLDRIIRRRPSCRREQSVFAALVYFSRDLTPWRRLHGDSNERPSQLMAGPASKWTIS